MSCCPCRVIGPGTFPPDDPDGSKARAQVIGHALDHAAYGWAKGLPVRNDRRDWTLEEIELYNKTYDKAMADI